MKIKKLKTTILNLKGKLILGLVFGFITFQLNAQTIPPTNTANACAVCAPPGWSVVTGSTDISNTVGWAGNTNYPWVGTVTNPPNGHTTWVEGYKLEACGTNATGLTPGTTYSFPFYMAELQSTAGGTVDPNYDGVLNIYDCNTNVSFGTFAFSGGADNSWSLQNLTFTATSSSQSLCFIYVNSTVSNGNFWNVSFGDVVNPPCSFNALITVTGVSCNGGSSGAATALAAGGTPPYSYEWSNGANTASINGLTSGTYTVTVTDANSCVETRQAIINQPSALQVSVTSTTIPCAGGTGSATVFAVGGTPNYFYNWSANANGQTTATATGLIAGTYFVTVTDRNQCKRFGSVSLAPGTPLSLLVSETDITCNGEKDGTATVSAVGGTLPFTYLWSANANGQTSMTAKNLDVGTYTVTLTDAGGCSAVETATITEPDRIFIDFNVVNVGCDSVDDGMTTATSVSGIPPISYQWDVNAGNQTTTTASNLATGLYRVTLTDANGCDAIGGVTVNAENCAPPCETNPCVEAIVTNVNICSVLSNDPADPLSTVDCDGDGVTNADECTDGTDPLDPCDYVDTSITLPVTADQSGCPMPCPDLTPVMTILPGNIAGQSAVEVAIQITELDSVSTNGSTISVRVPSDPRFVFVWNIGLTMAALVPVQNADWNYLGDNGIVHTWTYNGPGLIIESGGVSAFGFQSFYDPQSTDGQTTLTATLLPFSGGECNALNNTDSERLVYFE